MAQAQVNPTQLTVNKDRKLSKSQKKRLKQYQSLGNVSKAKTDKAKFDAKYASLYSKSFTRRKKLTKAPLYEQFCAILSIRNSRTLNPGQNFLDFLASLITIYIGKNQTVSISKYTSNNHINLKPLNITNIDMLIPYYAPRDKISFIIPKQQLIANNNDIDNKLDDDDDIDIHTVNASYAFAALGDQRLFPDNKCNPYVLNEHFEWTILNGICIKPRKISNKSSFEKVIGAAILSDGSTNTYCIYGTRNGLFYNLNNSSHKLKKLLSYMVEGIFRQNDYLFVLCSGPILYNISLTNNASIHCEIIFNTSKQYNVFGIFNSFIGGYYDNNNQILYLGTNHAQIYAFNNGGLINKIFLNRYNNFRKKQFQILEIGNVLYYDIDRNCLVYVGNKKVMKINLETINGKYPINDNDFGKIYDIKWFLKGITYDCNFFMYIYHQKTLIVLKRVASSAHCPYVLKIYTGKSLRFT